MVIAVYQQLVAGAETASQTICYGSTPSSVTVAAPSGGSENLPTDGTAGGGKYFVYQWQVKNGIGWDDITGATNLSYSPEVMTTTTIFRQRQTDTYYTPNHVVYTNEITITVNSVCPWPPSPELPVLPSTEVLTIPPRQG